jgi:hypothetical protein
LQQHWAANGAVTRRGVLSTRIRAAPQFERVQVCGPSPIFAPRGNSGVSDLPGVRQWQEPISQEVVPKKRTTTAFCCLLAPNGHNLPLWAVTSQAPLPGTFLLRGRERHTRVGAWATCCCTGQFALGPPLPRKPSSSLPIAMA